ncbi:ABC transporter permease [Ammoniphilus resinae]|uniref:ABC-2 type transport system permease protein n=1 Tax=Ammoniphilus resinae TaxID=861532 RepID=A0ABS4GLR3_9BACL|nr:ABC transporter permease [Ammoniphilus resinae]MBP1931191.1 ABC-2 type transport system permease protein [Ammoniphilus resinae]
MADLNQLWKKRLWGFWEDAMRYLRIIVMGYVYFPILLLIGLAFLYQYLTRQLPSSFPLGWILSFFLAWLLARSRPRTFLEEADLIFLRPVHHQMGTYFRKAVIYSFFIYSIQLLAFLALLSPLLGIYLAGSGQILPFLIPLLVLLLWNLILARQEMRAQQPLLLFGYKMIRFLLNLIVCLQIFQVIPLYWVVDLTVLFIIAFLSWRKGKEENYNWTFLLQVERKKKTSFYSYIHWFMETPEQQTTMAHRRNLRFQFLRLPYQPRSTYFYFYLKSLVREKEVFYPYIRLTMISTALMFWHVPLYISLLISVLALLLNGFQLYQVWPRLDSFWFHLYPLPLRSREDGFLRTLFVLLTIHITAMSIVTLWSQGFGKGGLLWLVGMFFLAGWVYVGIRKKIRIHL